MSSNEYRITGQVIQEETQEKISELLVKAFDREMRRAEPLGETTTNAEDRYTIRLTKEQIGQAESVGKDHIDIVVRVFRAGDDTVLAESKTYFNAFKSRTTLEIEDLVIPAPASEYDTAIAKLKPILKDKSGKTIRLADITDEYLKFLVKNTGIDEVTIKRLRLADTLAKETKLRTNVLYGLTSSELPLKDVNDLLRLDEARLSGALKAAIEVNTISRRLRSSISDVLKRFEDLKCDRGLLKRYKQPIKLWNHDTNLLLTDWRVRVVDPESHRTILASISLRRGEITFPYTTPPPAEGTEVPPRHLRVELLNAAGEIVHTHDLTTQPDEPIEIRVPDFDLQPVAHRLTELRETLFLPENLVNFLTGADIKIDTLAAIRRTGGLHHLDLPEDINPEAVKTLEAHANLSMVSLNIVDNQKLIDKGFYNLTDITALSRHSFIKKMREGDDDTELPLDKLIPMHAAAVAEERALSNKLTDILAAKATYGIEKLPENLPPEGIDAVTEIAGDQCECRDCEAAVSPLAYLADLLAYTLKHIEIEKEGIYVPITLNDIQNQFHQPFGELPVSCPSLENQVRQVRLCIEVLRRYLDAQSLLLSSRDEESYCLAAYTTLLTKLGTSYDELRLARYAEEEERQALALRLGLDSPTASHELKPLDELLVDLGALTEAWLERMFDLVDTDINRNPLSDGPVYSEKLIRHWHLEGVEWLWNTDKSGLIHAEISEIPDSDPRSFRLDLYRKSAKRAEQLVASGVWDSEQGIFNLAPKNFSELSGTVALSSSALADGDRFQLAAIPRFLCWRLQNLRSLWKTQDWPLDPYVEDGRVPDDAEIDLLPVIDPDAISPDDFRDPFAGTNPLFDLWIQRRQWVDEQLTALRTLRETDGIVVLLDQMRDTLSSWPTSTGLETLHEELIHGKDVDALSDRIINDLHLTLESFNRLITLYTKGKEAEDEVQAEEWEEVYSILVQAQKQSLFPTWREEEASLTDQVLLSPRYFWISQRESEAGIWPPVRKEDQPWIDPDTINPKDLPEDTVGRQATLLWQARREQLDEFAQALKTAHKEVDFNAMVTEALGDVSVISSAYSAWDNYLIDLANRFRTAEAEATGGDRTNLETVLTEITNLSLTPESLRRIVEIQRKKQPSEGEWGEVYTLLTSSHKRQQNWPSIWRTEEDDDPVIAGAYWNALKPRLPKWRATVASRLQWRLALRQRSSAPIIDPDVISRRYLRDIDSGAVYDLWQERWEWINYLDWLPRNLDRFDAFVTEKLFGSITRTTLEAQCRNLHASGIDSLIRYALGISVIELNGLSSASDEEKITQELGLSLEEFEQLTTLVSDPSATPSDWDTFFSILARACLMARLLQLKRNWEQGLAVIPQLEQLGLSIEALLCLLRVRALAITAGTILDSERQDVSFILFQVQKQRNFADWRAEELNHDIYLSPDFFQLPTPPEPTFPPPEPEWLPPWRATWRDRRDWEDTLETRIEQANTTIAALQEAVSVTEAETLPKLRDALVKATRVEGRGFAEKAKTITKTLLIDACNSGCRQTTRVGQAIETLRKLLESLREGQLADIGLKLVDTDNFDEEWQWIGFYATWRSAMFVFMYPENILIPSLRTWKTPAFQSLIQESQENPRFSPGAARAAAERYSIYLKDVANLIPEAAVQANAEFLDGHLVIFAFARSSETGALYVSWYEADSPDNSLYPQSPWMPMPGLEQESEVVGVTTYENLVYLFALIQEEEQQKLVVTRCDLGQSETWINLGQNWSEPKELELPEEVSKQSFSIVLEQNASPMEPKVAVCFNISPRPIYVRTFDTQEMDWKYSSSWGLFDLRAYNVYLDKLISMIYLGEGRHCLVAQRHNGNLLYRIIDDRDDDGKWEEISISSKGFYKSSAFLWPETTCVYLVWRKEGSDTQFGYHQLKIIDGRHGTYEGDLPEFNNWLNETFGCSLHLRDRTFSVNEKTWNLHYVFMNPEVFAAEEYENDIAKAKDKIKGELNLFLQTLCEDKKWSFINKKVKIFARGESLWDALYSLLDGEQVLVNVRPVMDVKELGELNVREIEFVAKSSGSAIYKPSGSNTALFHAEFTRREDDALISSNSTQLSSNMTAPFEIAEEFSTSELRNRRHQVANLFLTRNRNAPASVLAYLEEAYYFVPIQLALQLHRQGLYTNALDWFRTVYDYSVPTAQRKISYVLRREESFSDDYERVTDWLLDPLNPHLIASTRKNTYTRFTLQALIRCLLDYADAEFTRDTAESVPNARTLYMTALDLLDTGELHEFPSLCEQLMIEVKDLTEGRIPEDEPSKEVFSSLWPIIVGNASMLSALVELLTETLPPTEPIDPGDFVRILKYVVETPRTPPRPIETWFEAKSATLEKVYRTLLTQPEVSDIVMKAGEHRRDATDRWLSIAYAGGLRPDILGGMAENTPTSVIEEPLPIDIDAVLAKEEPLSVLTRYTPGTPYGFCIPKNPVLDFLRLRAELNLYKIRTCRNIAGIERQLDPYAAPTDTTTGLPQIGAGGNLMPPGAIDIQPTPYRYAVVIERAKQLAQLAGQMEAAMLSALEKRDAEYYNLLKAKQDVTVTRAGVQLQTLRVSEAEDSVELAELQQERAQIQVDTYQEWISAGLNEYEQRMLLCYDIAMHAKIWAAAQTGAAQAAGVLAMNEPTVWQAVMAGIAAGAYVGAAINTGIAIYYETEAQRAAIYASHERRKQEWTLQKAVATQDVRIGAQQINLAQDRVHIVGQELKIANIQADHAQEVVDFLNTKFTNVELYDWMSGVLEGVYSFFLQQATALAQTAANQLAFERQEVPLAYIQTDYWEAPTSALMTSGQGNGPDRRGLTGSARLLQDIVKLDQYAFDTDKQKLQLTKTFSLARLRPYEFAQFRQTGVLLFNTPMELFDRDFPGHYLRLIKRVRTSVIALIPPTEGIKATLTSVGTSRVVIGSGGFFQKITLPPRTDSVALTSPTNATGLFELTPENQSMFLPFESMGVDAAWQFAMPKAANGFDYSTIADILITVDYTALNSYDYRQQVLQTLDDKVSAERPFSFRDQFADAWYDLHNPDQTTQPMTVQFRTRRQDFPPNLSDVKLQKLLLYFVTVDGLPRELKVGLSFTEEGGTGSAGGEASIDDKGLISTQTNGSAWLPITGNKAPWGTWTLTLIDQPNIRNLFASDMIEDMLFVVTFSGRTQAWPV